MSRKINLSHLTKEQKEKIHSDLTIRIEPSKFAQNAIAELLHLYEISGHCVYLPFAYNVSIARPKMSLLPSVDFKFSAQLYDTQKEIQSSAIKNMNNTGSYIIAAYPGFGKSITSISIMSKIKLRTLIIVNRVVLVEQWKAALEDFCPGIFVEYITAKSVILDGNPPDVMIMNAINVRKKDPSFYTGVGFVIVDEIHLIMSRVLSQSLQMITPRYLLGLSATPYRVDGLNSLITFFFGSEKTHIPLYHKHKVYKVNTGFSPKIDRTSGHLNWGAVIESQANNIERNELIISIVKKFKDRVFLILSKRVDQANYIFQRLQEEKEDVTSLIGSQQTFERESRILIGITSKVGTGFNHPRLDSLILACDIVEYFVQYLGRIIRKRDSDVLVFDLVDNNRTLEKHFQERVKVYSEAGGEIEDFDVSELN